MIDPKLILLETPSWIWSLYPNQSYLGRVQLTLRRECQGSLASLTNDEWADLRNNLMRFEATIGRLFQPDRFNYEQLGNVWPQVHVHTIPRYRTSRRWQGLTFEDTRWGNLPLPEPEAPIDEAQTERLANELADILRKA
jgi:diadenosine tetraphosphate (Ap4A) HIT family hydrolase